MDRNILLIDDDKNILSALRRALRREGYNIHCANSASEAMEILKQQSIGVIISDQRMPEKTGTEFLNEVKDIYPDSIRIVLSGYCDLTTVIDAINRGALYKFITKPWEDETLLTIVADAFAQYELKQENIRLTRELKTANDELNRANLELENRVEKKQKLLQINTKMLEISHEMLEELPVGVIGIDPDNFIVVANKCATQTLAPKGEFILGRSAGKVLPPKISELHQRLQEASPIETKLEIDNAPVNIFATRLNERFSSKSSVIVLIRDL